MQIERKITKWKFFSHRSIGSIEMFHLWYDLRFESLMKILSTNMYVNGTEKLHSVALFEKMKRTWSNINSIDTKGETLNVIASRKLQSVR